MNTIVTLGFFERSTGLESGVIFLKLPFKVARLDFLGLIPPNFEH